MLANVFLHQVLDEWFVKDVQPRMQGRCFLTRFADDFIIGCELEADARRMMDVLPKRFARFRLTIHPEKTALIAFKRPPSRDQIGRGNGHIRLSRIYPLLGANTPGILGHQAQDGRETPASHARRRCGDGVATNRHAPLQEQYQMLCAEAARALPVLWYPWQLPPAGGGPRMRRRRGGTG